MAFNKFDLVINLPLEKRQAGQPFPSRRRSALFWLQKHVSVYFSNSWIIYYHPPTKLKQGYVFTPVCQSTGGVSRPRPREEVGGSGWEGCPGARLGGVQAQVKGGPSLGYVYSSMHWDKHPPNRRLLLRAVRIHLNAFLLEIYQCSLYDEDQRNV